MKLNKIAAALVLAATSIVSLSATAGTQVVTLSSVDQDLTDLSGVFSFAGFNSNLGTLTGVTFNVKSDVDGTVDLTNRSTDPKTVVASLYITMNLNVPGTTLNTYAVIDHAPLYVESLSLAPVNGSTNTYNAVATLTGSKTLTAASDLAYFGHGGSLSGAVDVIANSATTGSDRVAVDFTTLASAYGSVTYTYTAAAPVPEPETYGMLLAGLGLMGVVARRKARSNAA